MSLISYLFASMICLGYGISFIAMLVILLIYAFSGQESETPSPLSDYTPKPEGATVANNPYSALASLSTVASTGVMTFAAAAALARGNTEHTGITCDFYEPDHAILLYGPDDIDARSDGQLGIKEGAEVDILRLGPKFGPQGYRAYTQKGGVVCQEPPRQKSKKTQKNTNKSKSSKRRSKHSKGKRKAAPRPEVKPDSELTEAKKPARQSPLSKQDSVRLFKQSLDPKPLPLHVNFGAEDTEGCLVTDRGQRYCQK